jgi:plastocyanin
MRITAVAIALALFMGFAPTVRSLGASPTPSTVSVNISPGGQASAVGFSTLTFGYSPAAITVKPGTTVVWTNKSVLPEPHFVTFLTPDPKTGELHGGPPFVAARPKPGKEGSKDPKDMEFVEDPFYVLPSEVTGAPFRNSGYLWPARMGPPGAQSSWKTTFTAKDAGKTLIYTCVIHPWMVGRVTVTK